MAGARPLSKTISENKKSPQRWGETGGFDQAHIPILDLICADWKNQSKKNKKTSKKGLNKQAKYETINALNKGNKLWNHK